MTADRYPLKDTAGDPLGVGCFVRVSIPNRLAPKHPSEWCGRVDRIDRDEHGPLLAVREWRSGMLMLGLRNARPEHCTTDRFPKKLRDLMTRRAEEKIVHG